ncbi:DUF4214 domain-containing protein [Candidatus Saccharibacteria bacterium]|nr:DUF4214 domain-containing protein [Candidatus Saccharibacteria bacterium]
MVKKQKKLVSKNKSKRNTVGSGGLRAHKSFNYRRNIVIILAVALVGGFFVYRSFAGTAVTTPSEFIARTHTEALGRLPTQPEWNRWQSFYKSTACNEVSLSSLILDVYQSNEYNALPYTNDSKVFTIYRGVLSREPDPSGYAYWKGRANNGTSQKDIILSILRSSEFKRLSGQICSNTNYPLKGQPFTLTKKTAGDDIQKRIDAAAAGSIVYLEKSELVTLTSALLVKRDVTLTTRGSEGTAGRKAYANMARISAGDPNISASPVVLMPGATLKNVWVDGRMWDKQTKDGGKNNVRVYPTAKTSTVDNIRTENTTGAQNIMVFGIAGSEYTSRSGIGYQSDGYCSGKPVISNNLVINSANLHIPDKWSDGIASSCAQTTINDNEVLDASDVGIIAYRAHGALAQQSQIYNNKLLSAGNAVFGGIAADPLSLNSQELQTYPACMERIAGRTPHCDFSGLSFRSNTLWSGYDTHYVIGVSVGTRAWSFFKPDAAVGSGAQFINNGNGSSMIKVIVPLYVSGMNNATISNNFNTGNVLNQTVTATECKPSRLQLYNPTYAKNLNTTNITSSDRTADSRYIMAVTTTNSRDKCI